jgi:hypothetical protein
LGFRNLQEKLENFISFSFLFLEAMINDHVTTIVCMWALEILLICAQYRTENSSQNFNRNPICPILLRSKKFAVLYFCHLLKETKKISRPIYIFLFLYKVRGDIICSSKKGTELRNEDNQLFIIMKVKFFLNNFYEKMVFCYQNCSDLLWEKIVLMIEKNF